MGSRGSAAAPREDPTSGSQSADYDSDVVVDAIPKIDDALAELPSSRDGSGHSSDMHAIRHRDSGLLALGLSATAPELVVSSLGADGYLQARNALGLTTAPSRRLARNTVVAIGTRVVTFGVSLPLSIIAARLLGPHDKGLYTLFLLMVLLFTYCSLGVSSAGIYFVGKHLFSIEDVVANLIGLGLIISGISVGVFLVLALVIHVPILGLMSASLLFLIAILGPLTLLSTYLSDCQLAVNDIVGYNVANIIQACTQVLGFIAFFALYQVALTAAVLSYLYSVGFSFLAIVILLSRHTHIRLRWNSRLLRRLFSFGIKSYLAALLNLGNLRLDALLLTIFTTVTTVGYYAVATSLSELTWQIPLVMGTVLFPATAALSVRGGAVLAARACRQILLTIALCVFCLAVFGRFLVLVLYGQAYSASVTPLLLLLPGVFGFSVYKTLYSYMLGNGKPSIGIQATSISLVATIALDLLLIPRYGANGAAVTSSIAYCLNGLVILVAFVRFTGMPVTQVVVPTVADVRNVVRYATTRLTSTLRRGKRGGSTHISPGNSESGMIRWLRRQSRAIMAAGAWLVVGAWVGAIVWHLDPTILILALVIGLTLLAVTNRVWLVAALLVTDLTVTDYTVPAAGSQSLRTILGLLIITFGILGLIQQRLILGRDAIRTLLPLTLFFGIATISNLVNNGPTLTFLRHGLAGAATMFFIAGVVRSKRDLLIIAIPGLFVASLSALTALLQVYRHVNLTIASAPTIAQYAGRGFGLAQTPIALGDDLVIGASVLAGFVLFGHLRRWVGSLGYFCVILLEGGAIASGSRSALLTMALVAVILLAGKVYVLLNARARQLAARVLIIILGSMTAVGILTLSSGGVSKVFTRLTTIGSSQNFTANSSFGASRTIGDVEISTGQRIALLEAGVQIVRDHPFLGIGYDQFPAVSLSYLDQLSPSLLHQRGVINGLGRLPPHNDFLNMWVSFGTFGLLTFIWLHLLGLWTAWCTWRRGHDPWIRAAAVGCAAGLLAYIVHSLVHNAYDDSLLLWILLGGVLALAKLGKRKTVMRRQA